MMRSGESSTAGNSASRLEHTQAVTAHVAEFVHARIEQSQCVVAAVNSRNDFRTAPIPSGDTVIPI
jgi:hypothetical protein